MPVFRYKAVKRTNKRTVRNNIVALTQTEAKERLRKQGLSPVKLTNISGTWEEKLLLAINPIKEKDVVVFSRQFSVMISANVTIVESLKTLVDQTKNITFQKAVSEIARDVDSGDQLSDALAKKSNIFSNFYINIVRSGETSGKLAEVLNYLADEMEKNYDMLHKIRGAMIYPAFIVSGIIIVGIIMMVYVVPQLTGILEQSGGELPMSTKLLIGVSDFFQQYLWLVIILLVGAVIGIKVFLKTAFGRRALDSLKLNLPIFGKLFRYIYLVRFTRSFATLLKGGVSLTKGLSISASVVSNVIYRDLINDTLAQVKEGSSITTEFEASSQVPSMVSQMMYVGERTGKLDEVLDEITKFYSREINNMLTNLTAILEPVIMVVLAIAVGIMVAAVIMPMYNLASSF